MILIDIKCVFANDTISGSCSIPDTNTLNIKFFDLMDNINHLRILFEMTAHLENGTDLVLAKKKINFCTFTKNTIAYPIVHVIFSYIKMGADIPQSCPIEKVI